MVERLVLGYAPEGAKRPYPAHFTAREMIRRLCDVFDRAGARGARCKTGGRA